MNGTDRELLANLGNQIVTDYDDRIKDWIQSNPEAILAGLYQKALEKLIEPSPKPKPRILLPIEEPKRPEIWKIFK